MNKTLSKIAVVGAPNAGKSTFFNRLKGERLAVTSKISGTTRDRQYTEVGWNNKHFLFVDTAGLDSKKGGELEQKVQEQIDIALLEADAIIFMIDGKEPARATDQIVIKKFRKIKKPKFLAINKIDSPKIQKEDLVEFLHLGIKPIFPISALTGRGIGELLDELAKTVGQEQEPENKAEQKNKIVITIAGKVNTGKSSLFNAILQNQRAVVSSVAGTTRTAIDETITINGQDYLFIDTAGLKKKQHRQEEPDIFSAFMSFRAFRKADICLLTVDTSEEITNQDQRIAREIFDMQKGCVIVATKTDLSRDRSKLAHDKISLQFPFLWMCPVVFTSAETREGINEIFNFLPKIYENRNKTIDNQTLSEFLSKKLKKSPPKRLRDQKIPKIFSLRQIGTAPPTFQLLVNHPAAISMQFRKYLENSIIKELSFWGTPIKLHLIKKDKALTTASL